ncbi:hypothetical protein GGQ68_001378 [Sagittula marina]|uniref:Uncharacterized protein n=1 Tax=Sagittula marina TaxID=943940 RepID=A0A7W6DTQ3_9RHOB|nr:hypothetical protein [Sagittula marina]
MPPIRSIDEGGGLGGVTAIRTRASDWQPVDLGVLEMQQAPAGAEAC